MDLEDDEVLTERYPLTDILRTYTKSRITNYSEVVEVLRSQKSQLLYG